MVVNTAVNNLLTFVEKRLVQQVDTGVVVAL